MATCPLLEILFTAVPRKSVSTTESDSEGACSLLSAFIAVLLELTDADLRHKASEEASDGRCISMYRR